MQLSHIDKLLMIDLTFLRMRPSDAVRTTGFMIQINHTEHTQSGRCNVDCIPMSNSNRLVTLDIHLTDSGKDWYCGYERGGMKAVLVPFGQPDGSLILTYPMNGCTLEVRREKEGNRIYHDCNGNRITPSLDGTKALRVTADHYMDCHDRNFYRIARVSLRIALIRGYKGYGFNFGHTIICVKQGGYWNVYNNAISHAYEIEPGADKRKNHMYYQAKDYMKYELGSFPG